jgi:hypothetical protein
VISDKFLCDFKVRVGDPYSLRWECKLRHTYIEAQELFDGDVVLFLSQLYLHTIFFFLLSSFL